jgi:hypothetical protein
LAQFWTIAKLQCRTAARPSETAIAAISFHRGMRRVGNNATGRGTQRSLKQVFREIREIRPFIDRYFAP